MAIITEYYMTREDGVVLNRTYSDLGFLIERDGVRYSEAVDPATANRQYIETEILERKDDELNGEQFNESRI
jgi:hypothetical protein